MKRILIGALILVILALVIIGKYVWLRDEYQFSGHIEFIGNFAANECTMIVDGKEIYVYEAEFYPTPRSMGVTRVGKLIGVSCNKQHIGKKVQVFVKTINKDRFTIVGDGKYYIQYLSE